MFDVWTLVILSNLSTISPQYFSLLTKLSQWCRTGPVGWQWSLVPKFMISSCNKPQFIRSSSFKNQSSNLCYEEQESCCQYRGWWSHRLVCLGCRGGGRLAIIVVSVVREGRQGEVEMTNVLSTAWLWPGETRGSEHVRPGAPPYTILLLLLLLLSFSLSVILFVKLGGTNNLFGF